MGGFLSGYDSSTIGSDRVTVRLAPRILTIGFGIWFRPETEIIGRFEKQTVMTHDRASAAAREGQGTS
ncbi:MAG: hypothetical protein ABSA02_31180 [Trebonia sp.]|jgi:hypothetical protein